MPTPFSSCPSAIPVSPVPPLVTSNVPVVFARSTSPYSNSCPVLCNTLPACPIVSLTRLPDISLVSISPWL